MNYWYQGGWVGVDLFFVLSGFLISSILFKEKLQNGHVNVKRFLIRRGFKIYPAFWFFLFFSLSLRYYLGGGVPEIKPLMGELFFLQNYIGGVWGHTWSLAVEEHFYIGISLLFFLFDKAKPKHQFEFIPLFFFIVATFCFSARVANYYLFTDYSHKVYLYGTHIRLDSLFFGVFISYLTHFQGLRARMAFVPSSILVIIGISLLFPAFSYKLETNKWISIIGVILFYFGSGFLLIAGIRLEKSKSLVLAILGSLGAASYSIYLWHIPVNIWGYIVIRKLLGFESWILYAFSYIFGAIAFGWLMNLLIEKPSLFIRDNLFPKLISKSNLKITD